MNDSFMLGYDYALLSLSGLKVPLYASVESHLIVVGGSNAGKSTATLYWLYKLRKYKIDFFIADFKASHDFYGYLYRDIQPIFFHLQAAVPIIFIFLSVLEDLQLMVGKDCLLENIFQKKNCCSLDSAGELFFLTVNL